MSWERLPLESRSPASVPAAELPDSILAHEIDSAGIVFRTAPGRSHSAHAWFRMTLAGEVPDIRRLSVEAAASGVPVGQIDVRFGCCFQPFEFALSVAHQRVLEGEGFRLRAIDPERPVRIIARASALANEAPGLAPHLLCSDQSTGDWSDLKVALASCHALQPFNWIEGCVLDGLYALGHGPGIRRHLSYYFTGGGSLSYLGPRGESRRDEIFGLEAILPFASLARTQPDHPALALAERYLVEQTGADGLIIDRGRDAEDRPRGFSEITIEGCYTVAYPLACLSRLRARPDWAELAWQQIALRARALIADGQVAQRCADGRRAQIDWARGTAWFVLGVVQTASVAGLEKLPSEVAQAFSAVTAHAISTQRGDGLWNVYLGDSLTGADTSGSAGIAAALGVGFRLGLLDFVARAAGERALRGLTPHLRPDGIMGGAAQLNRGGEPLQREGFRVLAPFAMGLAAQGISTLNP